MYRGYLFIFFATVFFSSMETALKTIAQDFHPLQLNCTRFLVGGLLLVPFALRGLKQHNAKLDFQAWKGFAALGFLGLFVSMVLYQTSILYTPASVVSVLFSCNPVMVLIFACIFLKAGIRVQHVAALLLEVIGALIIIDPLHTQLNPFGITLVLLSAALFALYAVLGKKQCAQYSGIAVTCFSCLAASVEMLAFIALSHVPFFAALLHSCGLESFACVPFFSGYSSENLLMMIYVCVFVTGGGYAAYFMGMEATSAMQGSLVFFFKPVLAPILAMFFLGESIPWNMWAGIALILVASAVSMIPMIKTLLSLAPLFAGRFIHPKTPH